MNIDDFKTAFMTVFRQIVDDAEYIEDLQSFNVEKLEDAMWKRLHAFIQDD